MGGRAPSRNADRRCRLSPSWPLSPGVPLPWRAGRIHTWRDRCAVPRNPLVPPYRMEACKDRRMGTRFSASGFHAVDDATDAQRYIAYLDEQAATPFWRSVKRESIELLELRPGMRALD